MPSKTMQGTFLDEESNPVLAEANVAMLGIAFDATASFGKGTRNGPFAILSASRQIEYETPANGERLDKKVKIHNLGILDYSSKNANPKTIGKQMVEDAKEILQKALWINKYIMVFGGDHSISNAFLEAVTEKIKPEKIAWLRLDAHLDLREALDENKLSHGSIGRRIFDKGIKQVFVGIRDHISTEEAKFIEKHGLADDIFYCPTQPGKMYEKLPDWMKKENILFDCEISGNQMTKILSKLDKEYIFINIDIDVLDSNEFSGTGTPLPFGLSTKTLYEFLFNAIEQAKKTDAKILGFDIVEVFPVLRDPSKPYSEENTIITSNEMKAALLAYNLLYWSFKEKF